METIIVNRVGDKVRAKPKTKLGTTFNKYLQVTKDVGLRFNRALYCQEGTFKDAGRLVANLQNAGFEVESNFDADVAADQAVREETERTAAIKDKVRAIAEWAEKRGTPLFGHQVEGVEWLRTRSRGLLGDDMGLGKTMQTCLALERGVGTVIVCPAQVKGSWAKEVSMWRPDLSPVVLNGKKAWRWPAPDEVVIVNYDILPPAPGQFDGNHKVVLVADEAHALKNYKAQRTRKFRAIAGLCDRVWLLTGTPLMNKPPELWGILQAASLGKEAYGDWDRFVWAFSGYKGAYGYEWGSPRPEAAEGLARVSLIRRKRDVLDMPEKIREYETVDIPKNIKKELDAILAELAGVGVDVSGLSFEHIEKKITFETISRIRALVAAAKVPALMKRVEVFEESEEPVVVFSAHRAGIDALAKRDGWAVITGDTSAAERTRIVDDFQAGKLKGIGGTIKAMGTGVTLTRATQMVFVDLEWTPALNVQAEDRIHRIGQTETCNYHFLVGDHAIDQKVIETLHHKQALIDASVEQAVKR